MVNLIRLRSEKRSDELIRKDLRHVFGKDPAAESFKINTSVDNGIVTLSGCVESWQEKSACVRIAKSVKGVWSIRSEIDISPESSHSDAEIEAEIRHLLRWDMGVDNTDIEVKVTGGKVILNGSVGSIGEKTRVFGIAWVEGVVSVDDQGLQVKSLGKSALVQNTEFMFKSREEIKKAVDDTLTSDPRVTSENLQIVVDITSTVALYGVVKNRCEKIAVEQDAENTIGVVMVKSNLRIQPSITADSMKGQKRNGERKI